MDSGPHEVEFESRRLQPGKIASLQPAQQSFKSLLARARLIRVIVTVAGAGALAFITARAGIPLSGALCLFLIALPGLWVGGWLLGFFTQAKRTARELNRDMGSVHWQQELEAATTIERVKLSAASDGLTLTRAGETKQLPWRSVRVERMNASTLAVYLTAEELALNESLRVPAQAFASPEAFDAFCLALQRFVWEAQRL